MSKYELTVVVDAKITPAKKKALGEVISKVVKVLEGKVEKEVDWGEKEDGQVLHFLLELGNSKVKSLALKLNGEEGVKKHLIVRQRGE